MSIKGRIVSFQVIITLAVLSMALATYFAIHNSNDQFERMKQSRQQLEAVTRLAVQINRFSEQIAELLLLGDAERPDFETARADTEAAFEALRRFALAEREAFPSRADDEENGDLASRVEAMYALFREIDRAAERVLLLDGENRRADAIELFRTEIENKLDADLERLVLVASAGENAKVARADADAQALTYGIMGATLALLITLLVITLGAGYLFTRSLGVPIAALSQGAVAVGRGDLHHRIDYDKPNEFGQLARRFNAMAAELQQQRTSLLATQRNLEHEVSERTHELAEANRVLEALDRKRVQFLADVSHELKTPLTVLRGEAEVTLRGPSKPESAYRSALTAIVAQTVEMGNLIDDLLFLSRSEADELRFTFAPVSLTKVVSEAIQDAAVLARDRNVRIAFEGASAGPVVRADARRLKQAVLIVLDNAAKYADPKTGITVRVAAGAEDAEVRVRDHGTGIPPEEIPHVFQRFYRGARARHGDGSGLGLPIARWIVEKHQGSIDLSSAPGEGTEVRIALRPVNAA